MESQNFKPLPDKLFFRIGDVSELLGVKAYVLRYWETEFPMVTPTKSQAGHRVYKKQDVELLQLVQHLLYNERYSIEGARKRIRELKKAGELKNFREAAVAAEAAEQNYAADAIEIAASIQQGGVVVRSAVESPEQAERRARAVQVAHELQALSRVSVDEFFA